MTNPDWAPAGRAVFSFAALAGIWLLFNLVAMPLAWGGVNANAGPLAVAQTVILLGFVLVLLFDLISLGWLSGQMRRPGEAGSTAGALVLGALALVALMGSKVMVDEIARETPMGGARGEWIILYLLLLFHLAYILVVARRAWGVNREPPSAPPSPTPPAS